jgi:Kef-type K+ transport system membrane component KefB
MLVGHPVFWILAAAVLAPLLSEMPIRFKVPVVVLEVLLGIVIGPYVLNLVQFDGFVETMFEIGMAATLFINGMDAPTRRGISCAKVEVLWQPLKPRGASL